MERNTTDPEAAETKANEVKVIRCYVNRKADQEDVTDSAIFDITQKLSNLKVLNDSRKTGDTDENKKDRPAPKPKDKKDVDPANFSQEDKQFYAQLVKFKEDPAQTVFDFPSTLDNKQRARVHDLAESLDLQHDSCGHGKRRYLSIRKKENNGLVVDGMIKENYYYGNYIGLSGPAVNMVAVKYTEKLLSVKPELDFGPHLQARVKRDGNDFHVTMVSKADLEQLKIEDNESSRKALMDKVEKIPDDWTDVGLGIVQDGKDEAYFVLIDWPSANQWRKEMGLGDKDFHITVGYQYNDVHSKVKDRSTLIIKKEDL
jgi:hypothetical protein